MLGLFVLDAAPEEMFPAVVRPTTYWTTANGNSARNRLVPMIRSDW